MKGLWNELENYLEPWICTCGAGSFLRDVAAGEGEDSSIFLWDSILSSGQHDRIFSVPNQFPRRVRMHVTGT